MKANKIMSRCINVVDEANKKGWNLPLLFMSGPGFGKTTNVEEYCKLNDYIYLQLIPSQMSPDDLLGIEVKTRDERTGKDRMSRLTPSWYNIIMDQVAATGKRVCLFIDEITTCDPYIQGPMLNLIFSKKVNAVDSLPEDSFIVAAGNYAKNTNFEMIDATTNRFLLVNLRKDDYDKRELLMSNFPSLDILRASGNREDMMSYFGLQHEKPVYNLVLLKEWLLKEFEITDPMNCSTDTVPQEGLIGFSSLRALDLGLKFTELYTQFYGEDDLWARVLGDTLGYSEVRFDGKDKSGRKLMADLLLNNLDSFVGVTAVAFRYFEEIAKDIMAGKKECYAELKEWFDGNDLDTMTAQDIKVMIDLDEYFTQQNDKSTKYLSDVMKDRIYQHMSKSAS